MLIDPPTYGLPLANEAYIDSYTLPPISSHSLSDKQVSSEPVLRLTIQLMALMTDCVADRLCPRRTQEILLLLKQLRGYTENISNLDSLSQELEEMGELWQQLAHTPIPLKHSLT